MNALEVIEETGGSLLVLPDNSLFFIPPGDEAKARRIVEGKD